MSAQAERVFIDTRGTQSLMLIKQTATDPAQLDLFGDASEQFYDMVLQAANRINGPFFYSELRGLCLYGSPSAKWWGAATKKLKAAGYRQTGRFRKSPTSSRKGGIDLQWERAQ